MATYLSSKGAKDVKAQSFMPHETIPELTFEEERMQAIKKKSAQVGFFLS